MHIENISIEKKKKKKKKKGIAFLQFDFEFPWKVAEHSWRLMQL
jgi:hypothetical protein